MKYKEEDIPQHIQLLITGYLTKNIGKQDLDKLKKWVDENDVNKDHFNKIKASWILAERLSEEDIFTTGEKWNTLRDKLHTPIERDPIQITLKTRVLPVIRKVAAAIIFIVLGAGTTYYLIHKHLPVQVSETKVFAPLGSKSLVKLPDGSTVWLNAGSTLTYKDNFNTTSEREVKLTGEGFFKVNANPNRPFIVKACDLDIMALGTSFNVKAYPQEKQVITTLVEGIVNIKGKNKGKKEFAVTMKPKQTITYYADKKLFEREQPHLEKKKTIQDISVKKQSILSETEVPIIRDMNVKTELYTSWKDNRWIIEGKRFDDLMVLLERRYDVSIYLDSSELNHYLFSGTIENETLEQVFRILRLTVPISYTIEKGKIEVRMDDELKKKYESAY